MFNLSPSSHTQEIRGKHQSTRDQGLHEVLCRSQPLQRLQVFVWRAKQRRLSHAVVRAPQQVHATKGMCDGRVGVVYITRWIIYILF